MILPLYQNIIIIYEPNSAVEIDTFFFFFNFYCSTLSWHVFSE